MGLRLKNSSGNYVELNAPSSIATDFGLTLPVNDGDSGNFLRTDGSGTLTWATPTDTNTGFTWLTGQDLSGESSVTFTGIPTTATIIKIGFAEVSQNGSGSGGQINVRLGNGSIVSTGNSYRYAGSYGQYAHDLDSANEWRVIHSDFTAGNAIFSGTMELIRLANANWWTCSWCLGDRGGNNQTNVGGGFYNGSSGLIDRIQFYNGFSSFDDGNVVVGYA